MERTQPPHALALTSELNANLPLQSPLLRPLPPMTMTMTFRSFVPLAPQRKLAQRVLEDHVVKASLECLSRILLYLFSFLTELDLEELQPIVKLVLKVLFGRLSFACESVSVAFRSRLLDYTFTFVVSSCLSVKRQ